MKRKNEKPKLSLSLALLLLLILIVSCASRQSEDKNFYETISASLTSPEMTLPNLTLSENLNGDDADTVYVKSLTQTFLKDWQFVLRDGKIWRKATEENPQYEKYRNWELFLETGLPFSASILPTEQWKSPESIREIFADGDSLFAFDDKGRLYTIYTQKLADEKVWVWSNVFGWPKKELLYQNELVKNKRGWAMGVRRKDILWYEDRFGNQHHYGTMGLATVYFLSADGQKIYFTDSGMPADFSNSIQNPEHGSFVARSISCSGSTLFLISDDGTMYTRLIDFDTMGCDPMFFKYSYEKTEQKWTGKDYLSNYSLWGLPAEDWKKENSIPLAKNARLSRFISIHQNGQGNFARELRVAGTDSEGKTGYYYKQISEANWKFRHEILNLAETDFLSLKTDFGEPTEFSYSGFLEQNGTRQEAVLCRLEGLNLASEGKFTLTLTMNGKNWTESKTFTLFNVEMWTYKTRYNPGFDGTPKRYFCTVDAPKDALIAEHAEFTALLENLFLKNDKKLFALSLEATTLYAHLKGTDSAKKKFSLSFDTLNSKLSVKQVKMLPQNLPISSVYNDENLILEEKEFYTHSDIPQIKEKIDFNKKYISFMNGELAFYGEQKDGTNAFRVGFRTVDFLTSITLLNRIDFPKFKTMATFGNRLVDTNADNFKSMYETRLFLYPHLIELAETRIKSYENLLQSVKSSKKTTKIPRDTALCSDFCEYFSFAKIPIQMQGNSPSASKNAVLSQIIQVPLLDGLLLSITDEKNIENSEEIFVRLKDSAEKIYDYMQNRISEETLLEIDTEFIILAGARERMFSTGNIKFLSKKSGKLTWDGKNLRILVKDGILSEKILFEGEL